MSYPTPKCKPTGRCNVELADLVMSFKGKPARAIPIEFCKRSKMVCDTIRGGHPPEETAIEYCAYTPESWGNADELTSVAVYQKGALLYEKSLVNDVCEARNAHEPETPKKNINYDAHEISTAGAEAFLGAAGGAE